MPSHFHSTHLGSKSFEVQPRYENSKIVGFEPLRSGEPPNRCRVYNVDSISNYKKEGKVEFSVDYSDVAQAVQGDPRLEALHANVPRQITAQAALLKRSELFAKQAEI